MGSEPDAAELNGPLLARVPAVVAGEEVVPPWREQLTVRGIVVSAILGVLFCLITHRLNLTVGIIPSLNVAAGLLGYFLARTWKAALARFGIVSKPFTRQENTVIQTCVVACYGLAFGGGFGSYMLAMDQKTYELIGADYPGNRAEDVKNPSLSWMMGFMFVVSFLGLFSLVALRKVFIPVSVILGDGIYNIIKIIYATIKEIVNTRSKEGRLPLVWVQDDDGSSKLSSEEKLLNEVFVKDSIPPWLAGSGYVGLAAISTATVPMMFPQLKWYLVLSAYVVAPLLAFCNSYGTGLTDWNLASTYGKIGLFIFASWVGQHGGVIAGLAASGVMMSIVSTAADLMQDFKTGYLTLSSPRSMFVSQLIGTALGCHCSSHLLALLDGLRYWQS
ncbi:hypothetical protein ACQ4PT_017933 [Festuca glaucescens]